VPQPCAIVIFGATGDLTHRKLIPALYNLAAAGELPPAVTVVGFARRPKSDDEFRKELEKPPNNFRVRMFAKIFGRLFRGRFPTIKVSSKMNRGVPITRATP